MLFLDSFWPLLNLEQKFLHIMSENFPLLFSCLFFVTLWLSASQFGSMQDMGKAYFGQCPEKRQVNVISLVVNDFDSPVFWFGSVVLGYWHFSRFCVGTDFSKCQGLQFNTSKWEENTWKHYIDCKSSPQNNFQRLGLR